jgi:hypothetical protein
MVRAGIWKNLSLASKLPFTGTTASQAASDDDHHQWDRRTWRRQNRKRTANLPPHYHILVRVNTFVKLIAR